MSGFLGSIACGRGGAAASPSTFRYWRLLITATNGDVFTTIQESELRATLGGADQTTFSTPMAASSSHAVLPALQIVDDNPSTAWGTDGTATASVGSPHWIRWDLGTAKTVAQISLTPPAAAFLARAPKDFAIQGSNDDSTWATTKAYTGVTTWADTTPMLFQAY